MPDLLGIYGGTFNPIHFGHIQPVKQAAAMLGLNKVLLLPCANPPHRKNPGVSALQRRDMAALAIADEPLFELDERELTRNKPSYTYDTLVELKQSYAATLCFFIGTDSLKSFTSWYKWQDILSLCHLVVCQRGDEDLSQLDPALQSQITRDKAGLSNANNGRILLTSTKHVDISSTQIRQQIRENPQTQAQSLMIHDKVKDFIDVQRLYRQDD